jgi:hypothetical protein
MGDRKNHWFKTKMVLKFGEYGDYICTIKIPQKAKEILLFLASQNKSKFAINDRYGN